MPLREAHLKQANNGRGTKLSAFSWLLVHLVADVVLALDHEHHFSALFELIYNLLAHLEVADLQVLHNVAHEVCIDVVLERQEWELEFLLFPEAVAALSFSLELSLLLGSFDFIARFYFFDALSVMLRQQEALLGTELVHVVLAERLWIQAPNYSDYLLDFELEAENVFVEDLGLRAHARTLIRVVVLFVIEIDSLSLEHRDAETKETPELENELIEHKVCVDPRLQFRR